MFHYTRQKKVTKAQRKTEPVSVTLQGISLFVMDLMICIYLVLMIVVMPLYLQDGYVYIATDKANFCRRISIHVFQILLPALAVYLGASLTAFLQIHKGKITRALWREQIGRIWRSTTPTDRFMGLYAAALTISYLCSRYRESALWGAGDGWFTGFLPQIMLIAAYFFIAKCWKPRKAFFYMLFFVSAIVFLLGYLNRFSFYLIQTDIKNPSFISTIGNINWFCGYAVTVFFAGAALVWQDSGKLWQKVLAAGYVLIGFGALVTQGSASGILTLGVMLLAMFAMSSENGRRMYCFWLTALLLSAACMFTKLLRSAAPGRMNFQDGLINLLTTGWLPILMTVVSLGFLLWLYISNKKGKYPRRFFKGLVITVMTLVSCAFAAAVVMLVVNTRHPGSLGDLSRYSAFTFSDSWGSNRGATWKAGVMCFREQDLLHKLVGVGPDAMSAYCYQDGSEELVGMLKRQFGEYTKLTNAHNEWLTVLVNTGILGLAGFGGAMASAIYSFLKKRGENTACCIGTACGFALSAYTVNNIFSFQQTVNLTTMMVILGMGMAFLRAERTDGQTSRKGS